MTFGVYIGLLVVASVAASAEPTTAVRAGSVFTRTSLIYNQVFAKEISTVKAVDSVARSSVICHFDKSKATATLRNFVHNDLCRTYFPILCKELL